MPSILLKANEAQTLFFDAHPLPCLLVQPCSGHIAKANQAAAIFFNTPPEVLQTILFSDLVCAPAGANIYGLLKKSGTEPFFLSCNSATGPVTVQVFASTIAAEEPLLGITLAAPAPNEAAEKEKLFAAMVHETSDVLTAADLEFKPITWSKAAEKLYGITSAQAIGNNVRQYLDIRYHDISAEDVRRIISTAGAWRGEMSFVRPTDAKTITLLLTFKLIRNSAHQPLYYVISGTDISEQKEIESRLRETEKKLQQSETFYRTLISDSEDGKLLTTAEGTIKFASPSVKNILGFTAEEIQDRNAVEFVHPDDRAAARTAFENELNNTPEVESTELRLLKKDGSWLWCSLRGHNLIANPHVASMVISLHDDTQRKQATDALKESEERFRALIKDLKLGVVLQNEAGGMLMCNKAAADLFGLSETAPDAANLLALFKTAVQEDGTPFGCDGWPIARAARSKKPVSDVVIGICQNNAAERTWLLVNSNPVLDKAGSIQHIITSFTDITAQKKMAQRLLQERLNQQRRLTQATIDGQERERKEIGKELHDNIGQQLATTKLYLDLVQPAGFEKPEMLDRAIKSISSIIDEVRSVSHSLVPATLGDLGLVESVQELAETISLAQRLRIDVIHQNFSESDLPENGKLMLFRIIQEALNNCIKHAGATQVSITLERSPGVIRLQLRDNGAGFVPQKIRKGLGLHNIRSRAELFGGTFALHATPGAGCTIEVAIPQPFRLPGAFMAACTTPE